MKKIFAILFVLTILFSASALAEEVILPHPGYYFGRSYDGYMIEFDEYPKEEFDAYVKLLTEQYGMQITEEGSMGADEFVFMEKPGVENAEVFVSCFESEYECGIEIIADDGITLSALDVYAACNNSEPGIIAWDDGRMIADPGDFLGYEIECFEIADDTGASTKGYMKYRYKAIPVEDILTLADAINASPYFESSGNLNNDVYWLLYFDYTGTDPEVKEFCTEGRKEIGSYFRRSDLSIYIHDPYAAESEFDIYEYPGFTVNSQMEIEIYDGDGCSYCYGDGKCNECGGTSWVWVTDWEFDSNGLPELVTRNEFCNAIYCNGGSCTECGGSGHK